MMKSLIMVSDRATSFRPWQPCGWVRTGTWVAAASDGLGKLIQESLLPRLGFSSQLSLEGQGLQ